MTARRYNKEDAEKVAAADRGGGNINPTRSPFSRGGYREAFSKQLSKDYT